MISYFVDFAIIHLVLFAAYKVLLSNETSLDLRRFYLLGMTILALGLPLIEIPVQSSSSFNLSSSVATYVLPDIAELAIKNPEETGFNPAWYEILFVALAVVVALRFFTGLIRILIMYAKSSPYYVYTTKLRHLAGLSSIFTFFNWIFIDKDAIDDAGVIIKHERAHVHYGHSYDLLFLNVLAILFWWLPTHWMLIKEMKQVHEYQADAFALKGLSNGDYTKTLIKYTLNNQGLALANSFNDTTLTKRLKFMKKTKQSINLWKLVGLMFILSGAIYMVSCQGNVTQELETQAEQTDLLDNESFQIVDNTAEYPGGIEEFYTYVQSELKYTPKAKEYDISGKIFVEFIINKDGSTSDFKILRGLGYGLDEEAIRIIKNSAKWQPAKQGDKIVRQKLVLPIVFKLSDNTELLTSKATNDISERPTFPGGSAALASAIKDMLEYPEVAERGGLEGKVFVGFTVNKDGSIHDVTIKKGVHESLDAEAIRIIESLPNWNPAKKDGSTVMTTLVLPIDFKLN